MKAKKLTPEQILRAEKARLRAEAAALTAKKFRALLKQEGIPQPCAEHIFEPTRKWRFDWSWPRDRIALEVEGGVWTQGRHTRGSGFVKDCEKYNHAASLGWLVLRTTPKDLLTAETIDLLKRTIKQREAA